MDIKDAFAVMAMIRDDDQANSQMHWCQSQCLHESSFVDFMDHGLWYFKDRLDAIRFRLEWT